MDRDDLRVIFDILMEGERVADKLDVLLFTGNEYNDKPIARGYRDGFFGRITRLYDILYKYSKYDVDTTVNILEDEQLSSDEKFNMLFSEIQQDSKR